MTHKEALTLALDFVEDVYLGEWRGPTERQEEVITAIKEALAQPEQEPVAYGMWDTMIGCGGRMMYVRLDKGQDGCTVPLYTTPPQRKPLTKSQVLDLWEQTYVQRGSTGIEFARAIEAAHGIKE